MKIDRLIGILSILLQQEKVTASMLADKFEVSTRTISRDVECLCQAGIPLVTQQGMNGGISIIDGYKIDRTLLTSSEMQAILRGLQSLDSVAGTNKYQILMEKLSVRHSDILESNNHVLIDLSSWNTKSLTPKIEEIQQAIEGHHLIYFSYFSPTKNTERAVEPYLLVFRWMAWYVWGYCRVRKEFRLFKLSRMGSLTIQREEFEPREVPGVMEYWDTSYNPNHVWVSAAFEESAKWRLVEEFGMEKLGKMKDGRYLVGLTWSDSESLFRYLLGFGDQVELLEPENLRNEFMELVEQIQRKYR